MCVIYCKQSQKRSLEFNGMINERALCTYGFCSNFKLSMKNAVFVVPRALKSR